jgi:hypothetical protein
MLFDGVKPGDCLARYRLEVIQTIIELLKFIR